MNNTFSRLTGDDSLFTLHFVRDTTNGVSNTVRRISNNVDVELQGPALSPWYEFAFDQPVESRRLALIHHTGFNFRLRDWPGTGYMTESQLILEAGAPDDKEVLALDDAFSPNRGEARLDMTVVRHGKRLDDGDRERLGGRRIVGWRWRARVDGSGWGRFYALPFGPTEFLFSYDFDDCNENGVPDADEIESGSAADEDNNGVLDVCERETAWFRRGDSNDDGDVNIADPVHTLNWLFAGGPTAGCLAAANVNGDDDVNIADPTYLLNHLFAGGTAPIEPFPDCGVSDLPPDDTLGCETPPASCQ